MPKKSLVFRKIVSLHKACDYNKQRTFSKLCFKQEFCLVLKDTRFSKQFLMVTFAIKHLRILWSMMT